MTQTHYYLIGNEIKKGALKPATHYNHSDYNQIMMTWLNSLQSCSTTDFELDKVINYSIKYLSLGIYNPNPIEVTDTVEEVDNYLSSIQSETIIVFKQPKSEANETSELNGFNNGRDTTNGVGDEKIQDGLKVELSVLQRHRDAWIGKSDEWLFERLNNELKSKVEEIHNLLRIIECTKVDEKRYSQSELISLIKECDFSGLPLDVWIDDKFGKQESEANRESQEKLYDDFSKTIMHGGLNLCKTHFILARKHEYAF